MKLLSAEIRAKSQVFMGVKSKPRGFRLYSCIAHNRLATLTELRMSTFYAIDSTRVSHREYWWGTRSPAVLVGWILKWLRIRIPSSTDDPNVDSTLPFIVEALPPEVAIRFQPLTEDLARLGFLEPVYHVIRDAGTSTIIHWATFRHQSGQHFARIHQRLWQRTKTADRGTFLLLFSAFTDGTFVVSSSGKPDLDAPPQAFVQRLRDVTPTALWEAHLLLAARHPEKDALPTGLLA